MGGGVEVEGVHQVLLPGNGIVCRKVDILIPMRTAHQDDGIRLDSTDGADDFLGIGLHLLPRILYRFVEDLIDDIGHAFVASGHLRKEGFGLFGADAVAVPVDDDINILGNGGINNGLHTLQAQLGIVEIGAFQFHTHRGTEHLCTPVAYQPLGGRGVVEARPELVPAVADAVQDNSIAPGVHQLCAFHHEGGHGILRSAFFRSLLLGLAAAGGNEGREAEG